MDERVQKEQEVPVKAHLGGEHAVEEVEVMLYAGAYEHAWENPYVHGERTAG